MKNQRFLVERD